MKKSEVRIGHVYRAKVSGKLARVRIDREHQHGGWDATNLETNKSVRIKSAQRLRSELTPKSSERTGHAAKPPVNPTVEIVTGQPLPKRRTRDSAAGDGLTAFRHQRKVDRAQADAKQPKRMSALDAAARVLREMGHPMRAKELIEEMASAGLWESPGGKTPHATLYAAMLREINAKGAAARFRKIDRGRFEYAG